MGSAWRGTAEVVTPRGGFPIGRTMPMVRKFIVFNNSTLSTELVLTTLFYSGILRTWQRRLHT